MNYTTEQLDFIGTKNRASVLKSASNFTADIIAGSKNITSGGVANNGYGKGISIDSSNEFNNFFLEIIQPNILLTASEDRLLYAHTVGRPLNKPKVLSTLHGYTEIIGCHLDNLIATETEKDKILQLFRQGILLPEPT